MWEGQVRIQKEINSGISLDDAVFHFVLLDSYDTLSRLFLFFLVVTFENIFYDAAFWSHELVQLTQ